MRKSFQDKIALRHPTRGVTRRMLGLLVAGLTLGVCLPVSPASAVVKQYGGSFYWSCKYSYGAACIEPHYQPAMGDVITMDSDEAAELFPGRETQNRNPAAKNEGAYRCVGSAVWNGSSQVTPWSASENGFLLSGYGTLPGYGMIGTCYAYYNIWLYQEDNTPYF